MKKKRTRKQPEPQPVPELPEGKPMPYEANPGGIEGVNEGWQGGSSEPLLGPEPDFPTTYSTDDLGDAPRVEVVRFYHCETCGQAFETESLLNTHRRTAHKHAQRHA